MVITIMALRRSLCLYGPGTGTQWYVFSALYYLSLRYIYWPINDTFKIITEVFGDLLYRNMAEFSTNNAIRFFLIEFLKSTHVKINGILLWF